MSISPTKRNQFISLFNKFLTDYPSSPAGKAHRALYTKARADARANVEEIAAAEAAGNDITELVLLRLLPYTDSINNRASGAWIHWAPSITGDLRKWYENAHWVTPDQWPDIASAIWKFVQRCIQEPERYESACQEFLEHANRGFQTGTLTPILNALAPDDFALINTKSRITINYLTDSKFSANLIDYPIINQAAFQLVEELAEVRNSPALGIVPSDLFDMFCHWLVAVNKFKFQDANYWKIAPGEKAWHWEECREGGFISIGWEEFGDLSKLDRASYETRRKLLGPEHKWTDEGMEQAWTFAKEIREGDQVLANQGMSVLLGSGIVTGPYYFVPGVRHGHRLPVDWVDTTPRQIEELGWRKTLIKLKQEKFEALQNSPPVINLPQTLAAPFDKIFADRAEAEWAFDFLGRSMELLGVVDPDDKRCTLTLPKLYKQSLLRFNFVTAVMIDFIGKEWKNGSRVDIALKPIDSLNHYPKWGVFKTYSEPVTVYEVPYNVLREITPEIESHYEASFRYMGKAKANAAGSPFHHAHQQEIMEAIFDPEKRKILLDHGLAPYNGKPENDECFGQIEVNPNSPFSPTTFELLEELHHKHSAAYYLENKHAFVKEVETPFQKIMQRVAGELPITILNVMETQNRIFARILKNDFGQGGAWEFYWGAFYPKGSKRSQDAQLLISIDYEGLMFGFFIGDYASQQRQRYIHNCKLHQTQLCSVLAMLGADQFFYGNTYESDITPDGSRVRHNATLQDLHRYLADPQQFNCQVSVFLPDDKLLQLSEDELVHRISNTFKQLFPLVLLATNDDPMTAIAEYLEDGIDEETGDSPLHVLYTMADCVAETGFDEATIDEWLEVIERKRQAVLYGPPGTGKTYLAERIARLLLAEGDGFIELVQFHPAYAYEDFIQGIRPQTTSEGHLNYQTVPGRFLEFCRKAEQRRGICVLIIDEINRANLSRVFGELMYLLEYRERTIPLAGGNTLRIPQNVLILGTMNTADRSIALVDHALRRRFAFIGLTPNFDVLRRYHEGLAESFPIASLISVLERLNQRIQDRNYAVGTSYFLRTDLRHAIPAIWRMEIEPYLEEYFFAQPDRIDEFRWHQVRSTLGL